MRERELSMRLRAKHERRSQACRQRAKHEREVSIRET